MDADSVFGTVINRGGAEVTEILSPRSPRLRGESH
jgi:hypothetical protein